MQIQKPTILDAARLSREIDRLKKGIIKTAYCGSSRRSLYFELRNPDLILKYLVDKKFAYIGITDSIPPDAYKTFTTASGYEILSSEQLNFDRIVIVQLGKKDRLGRNLSARLIFEIIPGIGNAYLIDDEGTIKEMLRKKNIRQYKPLSPLKKMTVLNIDDSKAARLIENGIDPVDEILGLNNRDLKNLSLDKRVLSKDQIEELREYAKRAQLPGPAWLINKGDGSSYFSLVHPVLAPDEESTEVESALLLYERYYSQTAALSERQEKADSLLKIINSEIARSQKRLSKIEGNLSDSADAEKYKIFGDLILANIEKIERGLKEIQLKNLNDSLPEFYSIKLNPAKAPVSNANDYYKKYKKAISSRKILERLSRETKARLSELRSLRTNFTNDLEALEEALIDMGLIAKKRGLPKKKVIKRKPYKSYSASCGWDILVGRSNRDNDELTFKIASKEDYWFHAWQAAGSHTILRVPRRGAVPDRQTLLEAASLAAYHSKARNASKVPVIYTLVKYVRKPRKFPPGKVIVEREKQLMVKPADPGKL